MNSLYLIVTIAGQRVALPAVTVESVVEIDSIERVPLVAPHVAGLFALRSRVMTVIDSSAAVELGAFAWNGHAEAVIVNCDGHGYAILVENVDDVVEPPASVVPSRAVLAPSWARVARGTIEIDGEALLVVEPEALVVGPGFAAAA
jgi:purine-binding chemotaxis protein CheW